jgi:hypothetical protein
MPEQKHLDAVSLLVSSFEDEKRAIDGLLILADDTTRFSVFSNLALLLSDKGYWHALGQAYTGSDWLDQVPIEWKRLFFSSSKPHREFLMNEWNKQGYSTNLGNMDKLPLARAALYVCRLSGFIVEN